MNYRIGIVGCGNLAFHLVKKLEDTANPILYVFHPDKIKAQEFTKNFKTLQVADSNNLPNLDILICAVSDSSMESVIHFYSENYFCVSTSGTFDVSSLKLDNCATLYPLQTFNKYTEVDFESIPIFLDVTDTNKEKLMNLASSLSNKVYHLSAEKRQKLHVAAVIANNFTNHLFDISDSYCELNDLDFKWLIPLIQQSVSQLGTKSPRALQTGPAKRNDTITIERHLELLQDETKELYQILTNSIKKRFQND